MVRDSARARIEKPASQVDGAAAAGAAARDAARGAASGAAVAVVAAAASIPQQSSYETA
jgi:hypothetical protein